MRSSFSIALFSMLACRSDKTFVVQNPAPLADIISHDNGSYVLEGAPTLFFGSALDSNHTPDQLLVVWYVNGNVACEETAPSENGDTECEMRLGLDDSEVTLSVRDPEGAASEETITVAVQVTDPPEGVIVNPLTEGVYYSDQLIGFDYRFGYRG